MIRYDPAAGPLVVDVSIGNLVNSFISVSVYDRYSIKLADLVDQAIPVESDAQTPEYEVPQELLDRYSHLILKHQHDLSGPSRFDFRSVTVFKQKDRDPQAWGFAMENVTPGSTVVEWIDVVRI